MHLSFIEKRVGNCSYLKTEKNSGKIWNKAERFSSRFSVLSFCILVILLSKLFLKKKQIYSSLLFFFLFCVFSTRCLWVVILMTFLSLCFSRWEISSEDICVTSVNDPETFHEADDCKNCEVLSSSARQYSLLNFLNFTSKNSTTVPNIPAPHSSSKNMKFEY